MVLEVWHVTESYHASRYIQVFLRCGNFQSWEVVLPSSECQVGMWDVGWSTSDPLVRVKLQKSDPVFPIMQLSSVCLPDDIIRVKCGALL